VTSHITQVLAKLRARSRVDIIRAAAERAQPPQG
jgi:DNA-binding CsgD family transcriptional regulator